MKSQVNVSRVIITPTAKSWKPRAKSLLLINDKCEEEGCASTEGRKTQSFPLCTTDHQARH
ncbi:hypothetical protein GDO81_012576 [Engystomops pustulosus]|uniref:Uncharacterized protein n=1 Tax=Engystomops pustulosus TaxID=76066 RepID=A0AAV7AVM0_ENGPU|nr:hypothetical protein GDO81_012576 [Engystomops pustulosus]KAG8564805.1 hypothetical protein GDO81_012576 [Engystomops pustulosus]